MTMIEKVAKALYEHQASLSNFSSPSWDEAPTFSPFFREHWTAVARAAINAMREPSQEMLDAGWNAAWPEGSKFTRPPLYVWEDMISAALDEPPPS